MNYFNIFGIPEEFDIDYIKLTTRYIELQRQHHPDRGGPVLPFDLNQAYEILKDDIARAEHLLFSKGIANLPGLDLFQLEFFSQENEKIEDAMTLDQLKIILERHSRRFNVLKEIISNCSLNEAAMICVEMKYTNRMIEGIKEKMKGF